MKSILPVLLIGVGALVLMSKRKSDATPPLTEKKRVDDWGFPIAWEITYEIGPIYKGEPVVRVYDVGDEKYTVAYRNWEDPTVIMGGSTEPGYLSDNRGSATSSANRLADEMWPDDHPIWKDQ